MRVRRHLLQRVWRQLSRFSGVIPAFPDFHVTTPHGHVPYSKHNIRNELAVCGGVHTLYQGRLEEGELLDPDRILGNDVEFFESDVVGSGMSGNVFPYDRPPMASQVELKQFALEPKAVRDSLEDGSH